MDSPEDKKKMRVQDPILKLTDIRRIFAIQITSSERLMVNSKILYIAFQK